MPDTFAELGLSEPLRHAASRAGYEAPTPLQAASFAVVRRGSNVVLRGSSGAGVTVAFGLPLLDRLAGEQVDAGAGPRALVLAPTPERAIGVASALGALAADTHVEVRAHAPGWRVAGAHVLVTTPERALGGVQTSALKLDNVEAWVLMDAADMFALKQADALETLAPLIPRESQRIIATGELTADVERLVEAHARRALTIPARPADPARTAAPPVAVGQIGYMVVSDADKPGMLARLVEGVDDAVVYVRTRQRAEDVENELARRGAGEGVRVVAFSADGESSERLISYDVPFSSDDLKRLHATGGTVLVTPIELPHLKRIAADAALTLKQRRAREPDQSDVDAFRALLSAAIAAEDLAPQLLVLEPLFDDHSPAEVAAALSALLRRRAPVVAARTAPSPAAAGSAPASATTAAFTRLFVSIGTRDNIRAGDLVGAITGEAGIKGEQVGRVDIRDSFSVVEVASPVADKVIRALNGTTMRGRSLRVDYDRKGAGGAGDGEHRGRRPAGGARTGDGPRTGAGPRGSGGARTGGGPRGGGRGGGPRSGAGPRGPRRDDR